MMQGQGQGGPPQAQGSGQVPPNSANEDANASAPQTQARVDGSEKVEGEKESAQNSGASTTLPPQDAGDKGGEEGQSQAASGAPPQQPQQHPQQPNQGQPVVMGYPGAPFYPGGPGMPMGGRGPAHTQHQQHYHPQMGVGVGGPQQIPVGVPRNFMYPVPPQHMHPQHQHHNQHQGNMPQGNIQYNPNPNQMYMQQGGGYRQPAEGEDMGYVSGRGGRGGRGRRGGRGGRGGRGNGGRGKFNHYSSAQNPHQQRNESADGQDGSTQDQKQ